MKILSGQGQVSENRKMLDDLRQMRLIIRALGRRVRMVRVLPFTITHYYYNASWQVLQEDVILGVMPDRLYVYGNYIDETLVMDDGSDDYYYAHNHLFSTVALLVDSGDVVERYEYNAYGEVAVMTDAGTGTWFDGDETYASASAKGNPYTFTGRRLDVLDSGNCKPMHYRHRAYDTQSGRFMQQDPLGVQPATLELINPFNFERQYVDGVNIYQYVVSNPMCQLDSMGLNLYVIAGTSAVLTDNNNTAQIYNSYQGDSGPKVGRGKYYWNGPKDKIKGKDSAYIVNGVVKYICEDYCENKKVKVSLCGWSRGGAIALAVAARLHSQGCFCCLYNKPKIGRTNYLYLGESVHVNWIGLFDAVRMTNSISKPASISSVSLISHAIKTKKQVQFPTMNISGGNVREHYFYKTDGSKTNHSDIGRGKLALDWIKKEGKSKGLIFN